MDEVTRILQAIEQGEGKATEQLFPIVYEELRRLAAAKLTQEKPGQTLQATALVHEVYLRLVGSGSGGRTAIDSDNDSLGDASETKQAAAHSGSWQSRGHFFAAAAEAMRRILVEHARRKHRLKRGGDRARIELEVAEVAVEPPSEDILALDESLAKLEAQDKAKADVVKLRYFAGLSIEETAKVLGVSAPTVKRHWFYARAWLRREISKGDEPR